MRRGGRFFLSQISGDDLARFQIRAAAVGFAQIRRESPYVAEILLGIMPQIFKRQGAVGPGDVKRVLEQMFRGNFFVEDTDDGGHLYMLQESRVNFYGGRPSPGSSTDPRDGRTG